MRIIKVLILQAFLVTSLQAECPKAVTKLKSGQKAPCTGYLFSPEKEQELYKQKEELKITLKQLQIQKDLTELHKKNSDTILDVVEKEQKKTEIWRKAAEDSTSKLIKSEEGRGKRDLIFLILGVIVTGTAAYTLDKVKD